MTNYQCPECGGADQPGQCDCETVTARQLAGFMLDHFETARRDGFTVGTFEDGGETFVRLREGSPAWMTDVVRAAHDGGEMLPDDWRYAAIRSALDCIAESDDAEDAAHEWADSEIDVYTSSRLEWLGSHSARLGYCDEARREGIAGESLLDQIGAGQYTEAREVFEQTLAALKVEAERAALPDDFAGRSETERAIDGDL